MKQYRNTIVTSITAAAIGISASANAIGIQEIFKKSRNAQQNTARVDVRQATSNPKTIQEYVDKVIVESEKRTRIGTDSVSGVDNVLGSPAKL